MNPSPSNLRQNNLNEHVQRRRNVCLRCHYIGNQHLCGCVARIGEALDQGDLDAARRAYRAMVDAANAEEALGPSVPADDSPFRMPTGGRDA